MKNNETTFDLDTLALIDRIKNETAFREFVICAVNAYEEHKTKMMQAADCIETLQKRNEALLEAALKVQIHLEKLQGHIDPKLERAIALAEGGK